MNTLVFVGSGVFLCILIIVVRRLSRPLPEERSANLSNKIEDLLPVHSQHLPQLRQSLASADSRYVRRKTSEKVEHMWREERRRIVARFLNGVAGDFSRVERLAALVTSLSHTPSKHDEMSRAWVRFRFRVFYRLLSKWIAAGRPVSMGPLIHLTDLIANLSARAERSMEQLELPAASPYDSVVRG
jgi:hypothetical protein